MSLDYSLHYAYWHPDTAEHIAAMRRYFAAEIAPALPVERTGRTLDIGCGCGFGYAMLALGDLGFARVEGLEASEQQAARARKYGLSVSVTGDTMSWLSGRPDTFAVVLLLDVLEHFPKRAANPVAGSHPSKLDPGRPRDREDPECKLDRSVALALYRLHSSHELHRALALIRAQECGLRPNRYRFGEGRSPPHPAFLETQILRGGLATVPDPMVLAAGLQGGISAGESFPDQLRSEPSGCRPQGKAKRRRPSLEERAGS